MSAYPFVSRAEFKAIRAMAAKKKARRAVKQADNASLALAANGDAPPRPAEAPKRPKPRKRRKPSARKAAFKRLKDLCRDFVMLRAKHRTGGFCEVAMKCQGRGPIEVAYHVTPQAMGNNLKYDVRNLLGSCDSCNGSEYFARKRGSSIYRDRHAEILGPVFAELEAAAGRRQINVVEAREMGDVLKAKIEAGEWRK